MNHKTLNGFCLVAVASLLAACSGSDGGSTPSETKKSSAPTQPAPSQGGGSQDEGANDDTSSSSSTQSGNTACVAKGATGNSAGVGAYCDANTKCGTDQFCTADFGAPVGAQFCTKICNTDGDCGEDAFCYAEARGKGCVPNACK